MPATRKSARAAAGKGQSTLSFTNRVSKSGRVVSKKDLDSPLPPPPRSSAVQPPKKKAKLVVEEPQEEEKVEIEAEPDAHDGHEADEDTVSAKSGPELQAETITDSQIKKYWREVEAARIAQRVHQEDLTLSEKVLRYFDISSQYGPCVGVSRTKRWYRADRLGLKPPIEVLAVLLKKDGSGNGDSERSAMDRIMESTAIGSV